MKISIFNLLRMGICFLITASASNAHALQQDRSPISFDTIKLIEGNYQARVGLVPPWAKNQLKKEGFVTRPVVQSINDWQYNAIYLKAGIESLAKGMGGNELQIINENLSKNAGDINNFVQFFSDHSCSSNLSSFEDLDFLITQQNAQLLNYVVAFILQDQEMQEKLLSGLVSTNNEIYLFLTRHLFARNESLPDPDCLQLALNAYVNSLIFEAEAFVEATDPHYKTGNFVSSYDAYRASLDAADQLGRIIGMAFAYPHL
ncbi:MAG: hypothetical protein ACHQUC_06685 [Chlamydiales bacterium]